MQPLAPPTPPTDWHSDRVTAARLLICQRRSHGQLTLGGGRSWEVSLTDYGNISVDYAAMSPSPSGRVRRRCGAPRSSVLSGGQFSRVVDIDGEASCPGAGGRRRAAGLGAAGPQLRRGRRWSLNKWPRRRGGSRRCSAATARQDAAGPVSPSGCLIRVRTMSARPSEHFTAILERGEGRVQASCSCGWRSAIFGADKRLGAMDALQQAADTVDLHEWDSSLP